MIRIEVSTRPSPAEEAAIRAVLAEANAAAGWPHAPGGLRVALRDAAGAVIGGLVATHNWGWLWIQVLALPPALRGQGWGSSLLAAAEDAARGAGCVGARLDTYSFQARRFYEKRGYGLTGLIEDCPPGQTRYTMAKRLDGAAPPAEPWPDAAAPRATLALTEAEWEPAGAVIEAGLDAFNRPAAGPHGFRPLNLVVRRAGEATPAGGLVGYLLYGWLFVRLFYLPEDLRGSGLGGALLARAEAEARARGAVGVWLDTFSFQARPFYEKAGYSLFGTVEDFPPGHARHYLMKRLDRPAGA